MAEFKKGDMVVTVGTSTTAEGTKRKQHVLAKVIEVGKFELLLEDSNSSSYSKTKFKSPRTHCSKICIPHVVNDIDNAQPKVGDLVLSITENYKTSSLQRKSGILKEIVDIPWKYKTATLLIGAKHEDVPYESLIVIER